MNTLLDRYREIVRAEMYARNNGAAHMTLRHYSDLARTMRAMIRASEMNDYQAIAIGAATADTLIAPVETAILGRIG